MTSEKSSTVDLSDARPGFAVGSMFTGTSNQLGDFRAGAAAAAFGTIALVLLSTRIFSELYRADRYEPAKS